MPTHFHLRSQEALDVGFFDSRDGRATAARGRSSGRRFGDLGAVLLPSVEDPTYVGGMVSPVRRLTRPTAEIAFVDEGAGSPAVVLTHGAGIDRSMFDAQVASLRRRGVRAVAWDMRGHGESTLAEGTRFAAGDALDDLDALLTECGVDRSVLVGHSLGGNLVQEYARRHPQRVAGVIVLDSAWNTGPLTRVERFALRLAAPLLSLIPARALPGIMARASAASPEAVARTEAAFTRMTKAGFLDVWKATTSFVGPDPDHRSPVPIALVRGERDRTGNIATAMGRWATAEGVAEHVIPAAGHMVTWDAPDAVSGVILQTLEDWGFLPA